MARMWFAEGLALVVALLPCMALAQSAAVPTHQDPVGSENCAKLGPDIPTLARRVSVFTPDGKWRQRVAEWLIDQIARNQADELLAGERSSSQKPMGYVSAYKGARDIVELHQAEIDQAIRQIEPALSEEVSNVLCTLLSAEDIRGIAAFLATPAGQHFRMARLSPELQPENLPSFLGMARSVVETSRNW